MIELPHFGSLVIKETLDDDENPEEIYRSLLAAGMPVLISRLRALPRPMPKKPP